MDLSRYNKLWAAAVVLVLTNAVFFLGVASPIVFVIGTLVTFGSIFFGPANTAPPAE